MQAVVEECLRSKTDGIESVSSCVLGIRQPRRDMHLPVRKSRIYRVQPCVDACFAIVDLLTATDETNHGCPIIVAVQRCNQKLRLRLRKPGESLLAAHEVRGLP